MKSKKKSSSTRKQPSMKTKSRKSLVATEDTVDEKSKYQYPGETHPKEQMVDPSLRMRRRRWAQ